MKRPSNKVLDLLKNNKKLFTTIYTDYCENNTVFTIKTLIYKTENQLDCFAQIYCDEHEYADVGTSLFYFVIPQNDVKKTDLSSFVNTNVIKHFRTEEVHCFECSYLGGLIDDTEGIDETYFK